MYQATINGTNKSKYSNFGFAKTSPDILIQLFWFINSFLHRSVILIGWFNLNFFLKFCFVYKINRNPFLVDPIHTIKTEPGAGPRHMLFHPNKQYAYVVNELNGTVECFQVNKKSGHLNRFQTIATTPDSLKSQAGSADIHITSDGRYLYTSNRGPFNEIVCFEVNQTTGELKINGHYPSGGIGPRNFRISNNNHYLLVANQRSNNIVVFRIDPANGALTPTGEKLELHAPVCITEL